MKMHGEIHDALDNNGKVIQTWYPQTREDAIAQDVVFYEPRPRPMCPTCNSYFLVYTKTNMPNCCAAREALEEYRYAVSQGEPTSPDDATKRGLDYYWKHKHGKYCGHVGKMTISGKCYECNKSTNIPSPRKIAMSRGDKWYMPLESDPCKNGHVALRRVDNGACKQCAEEKHRHDPNDIRMLSPNMIITRNDAKIMGFKYFRTGKPCCKNHIDWRYVSTGNCISCVHPQS